MATGALVVACASAPPRRDPGLADDDAAIAAFQGAWARTIRPKIADPTVRRIDTRMQEMDSIHSYIAEPHTCRDGLRRLAELESLRAAIDQPGLVIHGTPDALLGRERCWSVTFLGGMPNLDAEGWLDERGRLLIAWRIPG